MKLAPGFVVGGRFRVVRPLPGGQTWDAALAESTDDGPGDVVVLTARYSDEPTVEELQQARTHFQNIWKTLGDLHRAAPGTIPVPLERLRMYPGEARIREIARSEPELRTSEPYIVVGWSLDRALSDTLRETVLDDEHGLLLVLRFTLLATTLLQAGYVTVCSPAQVRLHPVSGAISLGDVDALQTVEAGNTHEASVAFAAVVASIIAGSAAPPWTPSTAAERCTDWLQQRRVPGEQFDLVLPWFQSSCNTPADFLERLDGLENRTRALLRRRRPNTRSSSVRPPDAVLPLAAGDTFADRFRVEGLLAHGGRGVIYRVHDLFGGQDGILKLNRYVYDSASEFALELPTRRLELEHEYRILRRFAPLVGGVPPAWGLWREQGRGAWFSLATELAADEPGLVMERVPGVPLLDLLPFPREGYSGARKPGNRLDPVFVVSLVEQLARLMQRFHDDGYLFQDLKTENLIYDPVLDQVHLVDLAAVCERDANGLLRRDSVAFGMQTHGFAAPEFGKLWEKTDHRFDIYSLGATAWHLLTGANPERVALDEGKEYPSLDFMLLASCPVPVQELVLGCLAPLEKRFPSAAAVAERAASTRLLLSRSRPLDVRTPTLVYLQQGARLQWLAPIDPRIAGVRVTRLTASRESGQTVYEGAPRLWLDDQAEITEETSWEIRTWLQRGDNRMQSRGVVVRALPNPPPDLRVTPWFGGNRFTLLAPTHATRLLIRAATDFPPTSPEEGIAVADDAPAALARGVHPDSSGREVFYSAWAEYRLSDGTLLMSAPAFASSLAMAAIPDAGPFQAVADEQGILVRWRRYVHGLGAHVRVLPDGDENAPFVQAAAGATELRISGLPPEARIRVRVHVRENGIESDALAELEATAWPEMPVVAALPGPACCEFLPQSLSERIVALLVSDESGAQVDALQHDATISCRAGMNIPFLVQSRLVDGSDGPAQTIRVNIPEPDLAAPLRMVSDLVPVRIYADWPAICGNSEHHYVLRIFRNHEPIFDSTDLEASAPGIECDWSDDGAGIRDATIQAGQSCEWRAELFAPDGKPLGQSALTVRAREILPAPTATGVQGGVQVQISDDYSVDIRVSNDAEEILQFAASGTQTIETPGETTWQVQIRRAVQGEVMPWSPATTVVCPGVPATVQSAVAEAFDGAVRLSWLNPPGRAVQVEITTIGESPRLVFLGEATRAWDISPGSDTRGWQVRCLRDGLYGAAVQVAAPESTAALPSGIQIHTRSSDASEMARLKNVGVMEGTARVLNAVCALSQTVVEVITPPSLRLLLVVGGTSDRAGLQRIESALVGAVGSAGPSSRSGDGSVSKRDGRASGLLGACVTSQVRTLIPARAGEGRWISVWSANPFQPHEPWLRVGEPVRVRPGGLVGASLPRVSQLELLPVGHDLVVSGYQLVGFSPSVVNEVPLLESEALRIRGTRKGACLVDVGTRLDGSLGVSLLPVAAGDATTPMVLVPLSMANDASQIPAAVWANVVRGASTWLILHMIRALRGSVVAAHWQPLAVAHALVRGELLEFSCTVQTASRAGVVRVRMMAEGAGSATEWRGRLSLMDVMLQPDEVVQRLLREAGHTGVSPLDPGRALPA
jgi:serine/threonine protein kinase